MSPFSQFTHHLHLSSPVSSSITNHHQLSPIIAGHHDRLPTLVITSAPNPQLSNFCAPGPQGPLPAPTQVEGTPQAAANGRRGDRSTTVALAPCLFLFNLSPLSQRV